MRFAAFRSLPSVAIGFFARHLTNRCTFVLAFVAAATAVMLVPINSYAADPILRTDPPVYSHGTVPCSGTGGYAIWVGDNFLGCGSLDPFAFGGGSSPGFGGFVSGGGGSPSVSNNKKRTADKKMDRNDPCSNKGGTHPIELSHQAETLALTLFKLSGEAGLSYSLYYVSPRGWYDNLGYWLDTICDLSPPPPPPGEPAKLPPGFDPCPTVVTLNRPDGSSIVFSGRPGTVGNYPEQGGGGLATLVYNADGAYTLHDENGSTVVFNGNGTLQSIKDASGIGWTVAVTGDSVAASAGTNITHVTHTSGTAMTVVKQWTTSNGIKTFQVTVTDPAGNDYHYAMKLVAAGSFLSQLHPSPFQLTSLTLPGTPATAITYTYSSPLASGSPILMTEVNYNGAPYFYVTYDAADRAIGTHEASNNNDYSIIYTSGAGGTTMTAAVTNPLGHTAVKHFTSIGGEFMLTSVSDDAVSTCGATTHTFAYDTNGLLTKTVDNNGIAHTYNYAANGQLQTETGAYGTSIARKTDFVWDPDQQLNRLLSVTVAGRSKTAYVYNAQNRLASVISTNLTAVGTANQSLTTTYAYTLYANGMVHTKTVTAPSPSGTDTFTYTYDTLGNLVSLADGLGHATTYSGYNALGEPGHITGPNGDVIDFTYDARGRLASKTTHPNGVAATWTYAYDGLGKLAKVTAPDGEVTAWTRDAEMRVTSITHNDKDGASTETLGYDVMGDVTSDVVKRGTDIGLSRTFVYDGLGRVYQAMGSNNQVLLTYAYDGNGNVLTVTDALGHETTYAYDALNRLEGVMDAAGGVTSYDYDAGDHVTRVTDPRGLVTTYSYDGFGQLWKQVSPDTGTTTLVHDAYGRVASKTRADSIPVTYIYDSLNRVTGETAGAITRSFTWDSCTNGIGRLCSAVHVNDDTVGYSYSPEGWITARSFSFVSGINYALGYSYDNMGQLASVTYPDGNVASYDYTRGVVADVRLQIGSASSYAATNVVYRPMDLAMSGWTSSNGLTNSITYDSDLRPTSISAVVSLAFSYDLANHITGITNRFDASLTQSIGYDVMGRITTIASGVDNESYTYDADGNRTHKVLNGNSLNNTIASDSNRLLVSGGTTWGYDADGDVLTANGSTLFHYGPFGRVDVSNGTWVYSVSAEGQRLREGGPATTYFAPERSGMLLAEDLSGTWQDYVYLNGRLVSVVKAGQVYSAHGDQTGRTLALTNSGRAFVWKVGGLPFTTTAMINTFGAFNFAFPGQYEAHGHTHNGYREYNGYLGRYVQSDPIGLAGGINTYAYVGNNPVSNIDPLGLCDDHKCNKLERGFAIGANDADKVADLTGKDAAITGLAAGGLVLAGGGPEDPFTDVAAGAAGVTSGALGAVSGATSIAGGLLRTAASGGNFRYTARAVVVTTLGHVAGVFGELQKGIGWGASYELATNKFINTVAPPLPPPCAGVP